MIPAQDSIVRTEAGRLRARLGEYYLGEGRSDALVIELPKGGYAPVFRRHEAALPTTNAERKRRSRGLRLAVALAGLVVAVGVDGLVASSAHKHAHRHRGSAA